MANGAVNTDADDELLYEIDVEFRRPNQSIYLFQFPLRPYHRSYDDNSFTNARIKGKFSLVEMDLFIDPQSTNYYAARGKQFAENAQTDEGKRRYFNGDRMDKQTIASTNSTPGDCYFVGIFDNRQRRLTLCPLKSILQLRPQFNYLDPNTAGSSSTKEGSMFDDDAMHASDGEQSGSESEDVKPEPVASLVTMKFAKKESEYHKAKRLQSYSYYRQTRDDDRWQDLVCVMNANSADAQRLRREFSSSNSVI